MAWDTAGGGTSGMMTAPTPSTSGSATGTTRASTAQAGSGGTGAAATSSPTWGHDTHDRREPDDDDERTYASGLFNDRRSTGRRNTPVFEPAYPKEQDRSVTEGLRDPSGFLSTYKKAVIETSVPHKFGPMERYPQTNGHVG